MNKIIVTFVCGHRDEYGAKPPDEAKCATCGERKVQHVKAPRPTFRGAVSGPCAEEK